LFIEGLRQEGFLNNANPAATLMNVKELECPDLESDYIPGKYLSFTTR
jgi:hypothetical protein